MRIALTQLLGYAPAKRGGPKSNRALMEALVARGHACHVVVPYSDMPSNALQLRSELDEQGLRYEKTSSGVIDYEVNGVGVTSFPSTALDAVPAVLEKVRAFGPDCALVSCEDFHYMMLETALSGSWPVAYIAHTLATLPVGPASYAPEARAEALLRRCSGIISVSEFVRSYIRKWSDLDSSVLHFPVYGPGPFRALGRFDQGLVTIINPGAFKGISVFLGLVRRMPEVQFGAVPNRWDTSPEDLAALEKEPNVTLIGRVTDMDEIFERTRVLLAPSLGGEAFGLVVVEAMSRGIPVLASDQGGLPEAKLGLDHVLPVQPLVSGPADGPRPPVPEQDVGPWEAALRALLGDRTRYEALASQSRERALAFIEAAGCEPFERFLEGLGRESTPPSGRPTVVA